MAYRQDRLDHSRLREDYEREFGQFRQEREVTFKRVVNVERRSTAPYDTQRYGPRSYTDPDPKGYPPGRSTHPASDNARYYGESTHFNGLRRNSPPLRKEDLYTPYLKGTRIEAPVHRQVEITVRSSGGAGSFPGSGITRLGPPGSGGQRLGGSAGSFPGGGGQGLGPPLRSGNPDPGEGKPELLYSGQGGENIEDARWRDTREEAYSSLRDHSQERSCSPTRRDHQLPTSIRPDSKPSSRSHSPDRDRDKTQSYSYQQMQQKRYEASSQGRVSDKSRLSSSPSCVPAPATMVQPKDELTASAPELEEATSVSREPEEDFKTRRSRLITTKAQEIDKAYRQDCEMFGMVVKMLVEKAPNLEELLQAPLHENLIMIKKRCTDDLRQFIKELDAAPLPRSSS